jgi:hypothetical protein
MRRKTCGGHNQTPCIVEIPVSSNGSGGSPCSKNKNQSKSQEPEQAPERDELPAAKQPGSQIGRVRTGKFANMKMKKISLFFANRDSNCFS